MPVAVGAVAVTTLSIVWMFLAALRCMPRRRGAALAAAGLLAFSWELGYHARWIAVDAPLAQFCALELFFFCAAWRAPSDGPVLRWYCAAAVRMSQRWTAMAGYSCCRWCWAATSALR